MGCFLGCFGFTKKKRRRKGGRKCKSDAPRYGRYVPLDSDVTVKLDNDEKQEASADKIRDEQKESAIAKVKKKVRFNLNVKTYEPIPKEDGEETMWGYNEEETAGGSMKYLNYEDDLMSSKLGSFPANHRYQNCRDTYDEEDDIELDGIDLDDDEDEEFDDELDFDEEDFVDSHEYGSLNKSQGEVSQLSSASVKADERVTTSELAQERGNMPNQDLNKAEPDQSGRIRSLHGYSVLNPIENLSQWKQVKANSRQQLKLEKENVICQQRKPPSYVNKKPNPSPLNPNCLQPSQDIVVHASLSNWLVS